MTARAKGAPARHELPDTRTLALAGLLLLRPCTFYDARGSFRESYNARDLKALGVATRFVQDNLSVSRRGVIRGLHAQRGIEAQAKLISVLRGKVWDVVVDIRPASPTFGQYAACELSAREGFQLFVPVGFLHGFAVLSREAVVFYKCDRFYCPSAQVKVCPLDKNLAIPWPVGPKERVLAPGDAQGQSFADLCRELGVSA